MTQIKIGIDVGGTFTHAVAVEVSELKLVAKVCVPTTHSAEAGVAQGVIDSLQELLAHPEIQIEDIALIAHSTTQATNALLEGDVAPVGVIGLGEGLEGWRARSQTDLKQVELAPGKYLPLYHAFIDPSQQDFTPALIQQTLKDLKERGAEVIVASEAFGVDRPEREQMIIAEAEKMGLLATAASDISRLYGLKVRTLTAVINACMMPKMLDTANLTERAIRESGIETPLMVMRSDGGIMSVEEMRRRPILTMLSGPAAGVAAALMFARVSDGIFVEVGGTSSDITVIRNGKPQIKSAQIGGHRLYVQTLDVRTLGIAGGSIPRVSDKAAGKIVDVGPRSAHIAHLAYPAYSDADFSQAQISHFQPRPGDPEDYLRFQVPGSDQGFTITPTEAAGALGLLQDEGHGSARRDQIEAALKQVAGHFQLEAQAFARALLSRAADKIEPTLKQLMREYKLEADMVQLVGGGGGAPSIVPFVGQHLNFKHSIAEHCEVISAIGAALGLIRDSVERTLINPSNDELLSLRQEAYASVLKMGADPESIEVSIEIDSRNKKVLAIATGATALEHSDAARHELSAEERLELAAQALRAEASHVDLLGQSEGLYVYGQHEKQKRLWGLYTQDRLKMRVLDGRGTVKLQLNDAVLESCSKAELKKTLLPLLEQLTSYGDAGGLTPDVYVLLQQRILDLSGLIEASQIMALLEQELQHVAEDAALVVLAQRK